MSIDALFTPFFADIHDQRQSEKIHYAFFDVLFLTVCAVIGGAEGWEEIEDFGEIHLPWFQSKGLFKNGIPVHDTIARIISRIKPITDWPGLQTIGVAVSYRAENKKNTH